MDLFNINNQKNIFKKIQKHFGKSYYFATFFLPKEKKYATQVLYSFFRLPDEIVDNPTLKSIEEIKQKLILWKADWIKSFKNNQSDNIVLKETANIFKKYSIPFEYSEAFLDAMIMDTEKTRYQNYKELENYMYGSAAAVGLMMCYIIGFEDKSALEYAKNLGYAMQLTNFLRDIREDYEKRNRIYMPIDELSKFNLNEDDIKNHRISENFIAFMKFQINRARELYDNASKGINLLHKDGRFAVKIAAKLYEAILDKIEQQKYDVFSKRAHTSFIEKLFYLGKELIKNER